MSELGDDFAGVHDIDWNLTDVSGARAVAEAIARRWLTFPGTLFYDPSYGFGLETYLNEPLQSLGSLGPALENEALKDERVDAISVSIETVEETIRVRGRFNTAEGPFTLVLTVGGVTVELLLEETG